MTAPYGQYILSKDFYRMSGQEKSGLFLSFLSILYEAASRERVILGCPEGIPYETALKERVILGCPEGIFDNIF